MISNKDDQGEKTDKVESTNLFGNALGGGLGGGGGMFGGTNPFQNLAQQFTQIQDQ